ncbi:hypothetical protein PTD2_18745 [Pseudoalteromonas tunicata D2]|uniref:Uncharacterized protein n=1 Tax=Pseudoalteromonas tunicata D2 TaxID=87626 RepID=A4CC02_9GAMM|nr:hypothetical protein PTD2_18745 [Pseudoalteromonas tunicata D2]
MNQVTSRLDHFKSFLGKKKPVEINRFYQKFIFNSLI